MWARSRTASSTSSTWSSTANLGFKVGWALPKMVLVMLAGCVPFLSFWASAGRTREAEARLAAARR